MVLDLPLHRKIIIQKMAHEKEVTDYETGEVKRVNTGFVQLYEDHIPLLLEMLQENRTAGNLFIWLLKHMDHRNALVVSQLALAQAFGVTDRSIRTAVAYLKEKKAVTILKSGSANIYAVNAQIAWKSDANGKKYALFDAAVYISEYEQDRPLFSTQLVGHAQPKAVKTKPLRTKKTVDTDPQNIGLG